MNLIQIAGIIDKKEADLLIKCGVKYLGFPLRLPVHKEDLSEEDAKKIIVTFPSNVNGVLITYLEKAFEINELCKYLNAEFVQIHGEIKAGELKLLKEINPELKIIKSIVIGKDDTNMILNDLTPFVDYFITDTFDPKTGASGATGKTHDWEISREIVKTSSKPVILAGGLNPDNVYDAIKYVKPFGVDAHTGVEDATGRKSFEKVKMFLDNSIKAFKEILS